MTKTQMWLAYGVAVVAIGISLWIHGSSVSEVGEVVVPAVDIESADERRESVWTAGVVTERYAARLDRVEVLFEQQDYTRYRLQTNNLVRMGELNTERGFEDDPDATVYILNWQQPEGQHILYVRLTAEPTALYTLDSERKIIKGSKLTLQK